MTFPRVLAATFLALASAPPGALAQEPGCPLSFTAVASSGGTVTFHWSGFGGADGYEVFGFEGSGDTAAYSPMLSGDARDATATDLANGTYTFWVDAFHGGSVVASSCQRTVHLGPTLAAPCPTNVTASAGASAVGLRWNAVAGATGYRVARAAGDGAWDDNYGTTTTTSFVDTNVTAGETYHYRVVTQNTREPPEACTMVSATVPSAASVPFFPNVTSLVVAALGAVLVVGVVIVRARRG